MQLVHTQLCQFFLSLTVFTATFVFSGSKSWAQIQSVSEDLLTIQRTTLVPVTDNAEGIYSRPLEDVFKSMIAEGHRFEYVAAPWSGTVLSAGEMERDPEAVLKWGKDLQLDSCFALRIQRTSSGVTLTVDLFSIKDGKLLFQEEARNLTKTDLPSVKDQLKKTYQKVLRRIPFSGAVLSRSEQRVTVNLGSKDGIKPQQNLSVVLLTDLQRHPKLNFIVSTEKEIVGRIRVDKVEDTLSFGSILNEKERGLIKKGSKILIQNFVVYEDDSKLTQAQKSDNKATFGDNAYEWKPVNPPTFGRLGAQLGLGSFIYNETLQTAGSLQAQSSLFPKLSLLGEIWMTQNWFVRALIQQGILSASNPRTGSSPNPLNISISRYALFGGYHFLLKDDFFGPKISTLFGLNQTNVFVDSSTPLALTSTSYSGFVFGLEGRVPFASSGVQDAFDLGAAIFFHLRPQLNESPVSSGASSDNTVTQFSLFGSMKLGEKLRATSSLDFDFYSSTFSGGGSRGDPAQNMSQRVTTLSGGLEWLF